jgi:hypothetical protein
MKNLAMIFLLFLHNSCSNSSEKPKDFINRIKDKDINLLFNVSIEARNKRNDSLHYYYSHIMLENDTLTLPSYEYFDELYREDSIKYNEVFVKLSSYKGIEKSSSFNFAKEYAQNLDKKYRELGAIDILSNPNRGRFIEFILDKKCSVYYLEDATSLTFYWKDKFKNLKKVDSKWYYNCD